MNSSTIKTDEPLIVTSTEDLGECIIDIRFASLSSEPMLHFTYKDGREYEVPADLIYSFSNGLSSKLTLEAADRIDHARREENHPTFINTNLVSPGMREFVVRGEDEVRSLKEEGVPCLRWISRLPEDESGWQLGITGTSSIDFGIATWDDPSGIAKLIDQLDDQESLATILALTSPDKAKELVSRQVFVDLRHARAIPRMSTTLVWEMLKRGGLAESRETDRETQVGMRILKIRSGKTRTAIAVEVTSPKKPSFTPPVEARISETRSERDMRIADALQSARIEWDERFSTLVAEQGWRFVDIGRSDQQWITLIPADPWEDIVPAAEEALKLGIAAMRRF